MLARPDEWQVRVQNMWQMVLSEARSTEKVTQVLVDKFVECFKSTQVTMKPGEVICRFGDSDQTLFFVNEGKVRACNKDGSKTYAYYKTGQIFG